MRSDTPSPQLGWPLFLLTIALLGPAIIWALGEASKDAAKYAIVASVAGLGALTPLFTRVSLDRSLFLAAIPVIAVYALMTLFGTTSFQQDIQTTGSLLLMVSWLTYLSSLKWTPTSLRPLLKVALIILTINLAAWPILGLGDDHYAGLTPQKNFLGSLCLITYFLLRYCSQTQSSYPPSRIWYLLPLGLTLIAHSRAPLIAITVAELTILLWPVISGGRVRHTLYLPTIILMILAACWYYTTLGEAPWFTSLQDNVFDLTGTNIYSGRNLVWPILFEAISQRPLLGWGSGARPNTFLLDNSLDVTWSAHNLYYTIVIQIGYIGLAAFLLFLTTLWSKTYTAKNTKHIRVAAGFFAGICAYQAFECQLTQNNLDTGLYLWLIPALMLAKPQKPKPEDQPSRTSATPLNKRLTNPRSTV